LFADLINQAKEAASHLALKYLARASVAVPFVIALGFALAAIAVMLVQRFGHASTYWIMAGGLAAIGVVAAIAVSVKENEDEVAEQQAEEADTQHVVGDAMSQALVQAPLAVLGGLMTTAGGPASAISLVRVLGRNLPLVLLLVMIGALFFPDAKPEHSDADEDLGAARPNGARPPSIEAREHV
jgi:hypothetical protein